jgi:hypothetical protein
VVEVKGLVAKTDMTDARVLAELGRLAVPVDDLGSRG